MLKYGWQALKGEFSSSNASSRLMTRISFMLTSGGVQPPALIPQLSQSIAPLGPEVLVTSPVAPDLPHVASTNEKRPAPPRTSLPDVIGDTVLSLDLLSLFPVSLACAADEDEEGVEAGLSKARVDHPFDWVSLVSSEEELDESFFLHVPRLEWRLCCFLWAEPDEEAE